MGNNCKYTIAHRRLTGSEWTPDAAARLNQVLKTEIYRLPKMPQTIVIAGHYSADEIKAITFCQLATLQIEKALTPSDVFKDTEVAKFIEENTAK